MRRRAIGQIAIDGRIVVEGAEDDGQAWTRFPIQDEARDKLVPSNLRWQTDVVHGFIPREVMVVNWVADLSIAHNPGSNCPIEPGIYNAELHLLVDNVLYQTKAPFAIIPRTSVHPWFLGFTPLERLPVTRS